MSNTITQNVARTVIVSALIISAFAFAIAPLTTHAANYAFVNTSGDVSLVIANDPLTAIAIAINRAVHSGVMLLSDQADNNLIGGHVVGL